MTRVFLVDDHELLRGGISRLIDGDRELEVVGEASTAREALARISATRPDVVLLDLQLPDGDGIELCREILAANEAIRCLILTAFDDDEAAVAAVLAGAAGYILKGVRGRTLVETIRRVAAGRRVIDAEVNERVQALLAAPPAPRGDDRLAAPDLSLRERQVLDLVTAGLTNRQIGERLGIAEKTVKNYVTDLLAKLGLERRTQAAVYGAEHRATQQPTRTRRAADR